MITLKHVTASGALGESWQYDPERRIVLLTVESKPVDVPVCLETAAVSESYKISRLSEYVWQIAPSAFYFRRGILCSATRPYPDTHIADFVALTCTPDEINAELERL